MKEVSQALFLGITIVVSELLSKFQVLKPLHSILASLYSLYDAIYCQVVYWSHQTS